MTRVTRSGTVCLALIHVLASAGASPDRAHPVSPPPEQSAADRSEYLADLAGTLDERWPNNRMVTVVCHGHSVPAGYFRTPEVRPFDSYPHLTHQLVQAHYPTSMVEFIRTGIGGEHAEQGAARFETDVLAKKPDVVSIDYALNDRSIGLERARAAWTRMIEQAKASGARVILLTPTPDLSADLNDPADPLNRHAQQVRDLAREHGVGLVDSLSLFREAQARGATPKSLMSQANHPNRSGHELVARGLADWFIVR